MFVDARDFFRSPVLGFECYDQEDNERRRGENLAGQHGRVGAKGERCSAAAGTFRS